MKKPQVTISIIAFFSILSMLGIFAFGQMTSEKTETEEIDEYVKNLESFVKNNKSPNLIFADISQNQKPKWQKFESEDELDEFRENTETYSISYNWQKNNKIVVASFTLFSESGDWIKYVSLYFREDGTIAKAESQLNTFYGNFILKQNIYFNKQEKILKNDSEYLDLKTEKPKKLSKDEILENENRISPFYFRNTNQLPYNYLL